MTELWPLEVLVFVHSVHSGRTTESSSKSKSIWPIMKDWASLVLSVRKRSQVKHLDFKDFLVVNLVINVYY